MLAGRPCWDAGTEKKSLVKHINIYMEKSLKQKEQLEGYLRDKVQQLSQKQPLVILFEEKEKDE